MEAERGGPSPPHSRAARARAWAVHLLTASGTVIGLFSLLAITRGEWRTALLWMTAAMAIDGLDGTLARRAHVARVLPGFDGALLDNIVDYLNYAFVPAVFLLYAGLVPDGWGLVGAAGIVLASGYQFSRADAKTEDHFFTGFPSYWNIVVFYLLLLEVEPWVGLAVVVALCILVFVPFRYAYPNRTRAFRPLTLALTAVWGVFCLAALLAYPAHSAALLWASLAFVPYYVLVSVAAQRRAAA